MNERRVRAILEQAADEIGEQLLMPADRRIGAQAQAPIALPGGGIERLAHAVQPLMLDRHPGAIGHPTHRREGVGIVAGKLRIERG